jgi:NADH:ubiquinone oxidoreductase subunit 4 (subunit M)
LSAVSKKQWTTDKKIPFLLSIITWLPALCALAIFALFKKEQSKAIKEFATVSFGVCFILSLALIGYDKRMGGMQFIEDAQWIPVIGARYQMGVDGVSVLLIWLTTLLGLISALSSWNYIQKREKEYYALLLLMQTTITGVFCAMDLFLFFLFFELSLVPMYFLIGIWGGPDKLYAAIKFFLYTRHNSCITNQRDNFRHNRNNRHTRTRDLRRGTHACEKRRGNFQHDVLAIARFSYGLQSASRFVLRIRAWLCD